MNHLILKQTIDLQIDANQNAYKLQHAVSQSYWDKVVPALEAVFDKVIGTEELVQIEQLELNLGQLTPKELLSDTFIHRLTASVEKELKQLLKVPSSEVRRVPVQKGYFQQWLFFLEKGYLEQHYNEAEEQRLKAVLETLSKQTLAIHQLRELILQQPLALERLVLQHSETFLKNIIQIYTQEPQDKLPLLLKEIHIIKNKNIAKSVPTNWEHLEKRQLNLLFWKLVVEAAISTKRAMNWQALGRYFLNQTLPFSVLSDGRLNILKSADRPLSNEIINSISASFGSKISTETESPNVEKKKSSSITNENTKQARDKPINSNETPQFQQFKKQTKQTTEFPTVIPNKNETISVANLKEKILYEENGTSNSTIKKSTSNDALTSQKMNPKTEENKDTSVNATHPSSMQNPELFNKKNKKSPMESSQKTTAKKWLSPEERRTQNKGITFRHDTEIFIKNAGIVLLHPYWKHYFKAIELTKNGQFVDETARHKAVILLHYLATGETDLPEYEMVLPKLLCGLPVDIPIDTHIELTAEELEEGEDMMQVVLKHWGALGAVSNGSLREGFLQRDGKLTRKAMSWHLQVERKTIDMLLNRLPWGLGVIKLPWKEDILQVAWT